MRKYASETSQLNLLSAVNRHDRLAGVVGILPNALIKLIKTTKYAEREEIMNDLRLTAFWSGYLVWMRRHIVSCTGERKYPSSGKRQRRKKTMETRPKEKDELNACALRHVEMHFTTWN